MASQGIHLAAIQKSILEHLGQPPWTLGPNQGNIFIGQTDLTAGVVSFRLDALGWNVVEFRQETNVTVSLFEFLQATAIFRGTLALAPIIGIQQKVGEKKRPFALDVLEELELTGLVVQTVGVFQDGLVAVPKEALTTIAALQSVHDD